MRFRTLKSLGPGEIYRVDLIIIDRIKEKAEQEQAKIAKAERARIEKEETITVRSSKFPRNIRPEILNIGYHDGDKSRNFQRIDNDSFILKGPNKLGGEIAVSYRQIEGGYTWLYVRNVQKRTLQLPDYATIVITEDDLVSTPLPIV